VSAHALTLNAGSSSIKFALYGLEAAEPALLASGQVERIGDTPSLTVRAADGTPLADRSLAHEDAHDHAGAGAVILALVRERFPQAEVAVVGHRVVHGGSLHEGPVVLDEETIAGLRRLEPLAPLHQPHNLAGIEAARRAFPGVLQVGCFDTAFHRGHPFVNDVFALPRAYYDKGVRRYGFHGLSYEFIAGALAERAPELAAGRVVAAHLGNGASMCALHGGRSVASTMGFSALDGLPMGTRCGQLDPGVLLYLLKEEGMDADAIADLLYNRSGLLGLSGISNDMRTLEESHAPEARDAIDYFVFRIRRELGGLAAALGGLDGLVFTGGIGAHSALVRERVCEGLDWIGITLDPEANAADARVISAAGSRAAVLVIPTDEERVIARAASRLLAAHG
jgi:acetate kinase